MTNRQPYIHPDQAEEHAKSSFVNEAPADPAKPAKLAAKAKAPAKPAPKRKTK